MKLALLILLSSIFLSISPASAQEECHIDSQIWFTTGYEVQDKYLCTFEWVLVDVQYKPAPDGSGAPGTCQAIVDLLNEDDPRLNTLITREDGNAQIFHAGTWSGIAEFEQKTLEADCRQSPTS